MMKFKIVKKLRPLKNVFRKAVDHFPDVSNMVVYGSGGMKMILIIAVTGKNTCATMNID